MLGEVLPELSTICTACTM